LNRNSMGKLVNIIWGNLNSAMIKCENPPSINEGRIFIISYFSDGSPSIKTLRVYFG
jgi:hypothetical protein